MLRISISRDSSGQHAASGTRASRWKSWVVVGFVALILIGGGIWGASYLMSPERAMLNGLRAEVIANGGTVPDDTSLREGMYRDCDMLDGKSMNTFMTRDPRYLPKTMTRAQYIKLSDEFCASLR